MTRSSTCQMGIPSGSVVKYCKKKRSGQQRAQTQTLHTSEVVQDESNKENHIPRVQTLSNKLKQASRTTTKAVHQLKADSRCETRAREQLAEAKQINVEMVVEHKRAITEAKIAHRDILLQLNKLEIQNQELLASLSHSEQAVEKAALQVMRLQKRI